MTNLLNETIEKLKDNKKTQSDVIWCGSVEFGWFSWEEYKKLSNIEYDSGFGGQEIATDLLIVGDTWYLERHEYDGSEWWEFKKIPARPSKHSIPKTLKSDYSWSKLGENKEE